jgi:hypothetical protein
MVIDDCPELLQKGQNGVPGCAGEVNITLL